MFWARKSAQRDGVKDKGAMERSATTRRIALEEVKCAALDELFPV